MNTCRDQCGKTWVTRSRLVLKFGNWRVEKMERVLWASNRALWCKTNATQTTFEPPLETTPRTEYTYFALFSSLSRANCRSFWFASLRSSRNSLFSSVGWKTEAMLDNKNPGKMVKVVNKVNQEYNPRKKFRDFFSGVVFTFSVIYDEEGGSKNKRENGHSLSVILALLLSNVIFGQFSHPTLSILTIYSFQGLKTVNVEFRELPGFSWPVRTLSCGQGFPLFCFNIFSKF